MKQQTSATTETCSKGRTMIDFTGKTIYVGIDVHKKDWQVGQFHAGIVLGNHRITGSGKELIDFLKKRYCGANFKCVYESCGCCFNLQRQLTAAGLECMVVHAGDVPGSDKEKKNKTDKVDAVRLARHYAGGLLKAIHVPDEELQKERNLMCFRKKLVRDLTRSKNRVKSLLKFQGIEIPEKMDTPSWSRNFITWIEEQAAKDKLLNDTVELMLEQVKLQRQLFKGFDRLNSLIGFYPGSNSSGDRDIDTGISKRKHAELRTMFIEAAWQAIRRDPALLEA